MAKHVFTSLLWLLIGTATAHGATGQSQADSLRVRASGAGELFLGGNPIEGPWTLSYETGRLTVNGYGIAPPKPAPPPKLTQKQIEEHDFLRRMDAACKSALKPGLSPEQAVRRFVSFCDSNRQWVRVIQTGATNVEVRLWDGTPVGFSFASHGVMTGSAAPLPPGWREASQLRHLRFIAQCVQRGGVVFLDGGGETFIHDRACVDSAISQLRTGTPLDSASLHCLPFSTRRQIKNPKDLALYIKH
jgi:hypothetical protein